jgi:hypothetical protein
MQNKNWSSSFLEILVAIVWRMKTRLVWGVCAHDPRLLPDRESRMRTRPSYTNEHLKAFALNLIYSCYKHEEASSSFSGGGRAPRGLGLEVGAGGRTGGRVGEFTN